MSILNFFLRVCAREFVTEKRNELSLNWTLSLDVDSVSFPFLNHYNDTILFFLY